MSVRPNPPIVRTGKGRILEPPRCVVQPDTARHSPLAASNQSSLTRARGLAPAEVPEGPLGHDSPLRRPSEKSLLDEVRLVDVLDRVALLPDRGRERIEPDRPAAELVDDREQ